MTCIYLQVSQSRDLHQQLRNALESNANLSRLFTRLNLQLGDILGEDSTGEALGSDCRRRAGRLCVYSQPASHSTARREGIPYSAVPHQLYKGYRQASEVLKKS